VETTVGTGVQNSMHLSSMNACICSMLAMFLEYTHVSVQKKKLQSYNDIAWDTLIAAFIIHI